MNDIIYLISIACASVVLVTFQPILQTVRYQLENKLDKWYCYIPYKLITCAKCAGLWLGLIITMDLLSACVISILAELIFRKTFN